jgi:putative hemolysin
VSPLVANLVVIAVLLLLNGFFAMSEIALVSSRKSRLKQKADEGNKRYARALATAQHPGPLLSTMQVGITLIGIFSGALGEATLSENIESAFLAWQLPPDVAQPLSFGAVVVCIALASVFLGELVPKRIALSAPERIAAAVVSPLRFFSILFYPFERFLTWASDGILSLLGVKPNADPPVTEEELKVLLREGRDAGVFHEVEQNLAETMLTLDDKGTHGYLTQRVDLLYFERDEEVDIIRGIVLDHPDIEAFPVCEGGLDNVVGVVDGRRILASLAEGRFQGLESLIEPPAIVPMTVSPLRVLGVFKERNVKMVLVADEYGGIQGAITLMNILEKLFGEVVVADEDAPQIIQREDGSFLVDGSLPFADFVKEFDLEKEGEDERGEYHTLAGFVLKRLGRIPMPSHYFVWKGLYFEVMDMDGNRVDKILVRRSTPKRKEG